jgi:hypothetical protein
MPAQLKNLTTELVSRRYPEFFFHIHPRWVRQFKSVVGYADLDKREVPASFIACLRDGEYFIFELLEIDLAQLLHTTQSFVFHKNFNVDDEVKVVPAVTRVLSKLKSAKPFVLLEISSQFFKGDELMGESVTSLFVREPN